MTAPAASITTYAELGALLTRLGWRYRPPGNGTFWHEWHSPWPGSTLKVLSQSDHLDHLLSGSRYGADDWAHFVASLTCPLEDIPYHLALLNTTGLGAPGAARLQGLWEPKL